MTRIADLQRLLGPSESECPRVPWGQVEAELGLELPPDYRAWCEVYPTLSLNDRLDVINFATRDGQELRDPVLWRDSLLSLLGPVTTGFEIWESRTIVADDGTTVDANAPVLPTYPEPGGLLPWGTSRDDELLMWLTQGPPTAWPVVILDRTDKWWHFDGGFLDFLVGLLQGELECPFFSHDVMRPPAFVELVGAKTFRLLDGREVEGGEMRPPSQWRTYFEGDGAQDDA